MQVGGQPRGLPTDLAQLPHGVIERFQRGDGAHVADVGRDECAPAVGEAKRVLELPAHGKHRCAVHAEIDGERDVTPGAADRQLTIVDDPYHRVVTRHMDRSIVVKHRVGEHR